MGLGRRDIADLYKRRYVGFRNALATITGSYDSASDVLQEAFAEALRDRRKFRGEGAPEAWLWTIALRLAIRERVRASNHQAPELDDAAAVEADLPEPVADPVIAAALRSLPPRRRLIVFLHYFADLSYEQIAAACDVSPGTVAATLAQARDSIRDALTAKHEVEHDASR